MINIISIHIPKCGGVTFKGIINSNYKKEEINLFPFKPFMSEENINSLKDIESRIKIIHGHLLFGLHNRLKREYRYMTFLRDPAERSISHYYYVINNPTHYLYSKIKDLSFDAYLENIESLELSNAQVKFLSGIMTGGNMEELLARAKSNLSSFFDFVGLLERFDESLLILKQVLGWGNICYRRMNTGKRPLQGISDVILERLYDIHKYDYELYQYANILFNEQVRRYNGDITKDLRDFKWKNRFKGFFFSK